MVKQTLLFLSEGGEKTASKMEVTERKERPPFPKRPLNPNVRWNLICVDMDDWEGLAESLKDSKIKCERDLYKCIVEDFLPAIPDIIEARVSPSFSMSCECIGSSVWVWHFIKKDTFSSHTRPINYMYTHKWKATVSHLCILKLYFLDLFLFYLLARQRFQK